MKPFHSTGLFPLPLKTPKKFFQGVSRKSSGMKWFYISLFKTLLLFLNCFRMIFLVKHSLNMSKLDLEEKKCNVFKIFQLHTGNITSAIFVEIGYACVENIILRENYILK